MPRDQRRYHVNQLLLDLAGEHRARRALRRVQSAQGRWQGRRPLRDPAARPSDAARPLAHDGRGKNGAQELRRPPGGGARTAGVRGSALGFLAPARAHCNFWIEPRALGIPTASPLTRRSPRAMPYSQWTLLLAPAAGSAEASSRVSKLSAWGAVDALTAALASAVVPLVDSRRSRRCMIASSLPPTCSP